MTELWIDGVAAVLPSNLSVTVKRENPFFTKNGEYTYELTLDLTNTTNVSLYEHLNRLNSISDIKQKRKAILKADNRVYCNGTEIVTGWTHKTVTIQIASGNSELNYFVGSDLMISYLKMPDTSPMNPVFPNQTWIRKLYPEIDFCLSPIINRTTGATINEWILNRISSTGERVLQHKSPFNKYDYIPQPFLCAYIKSLLKAIGYKLEYNALDGTVWKDLYICHVNETYEWAKMLPGWSVKDFLEEIEKLFNVSFIVDNSRRTARLELNVVYFANSPTIHIRNIVDEYEAENEEDESEEDHQHSNISYSFPDNSYYKHRSLPESVVNKAKMVMIPKETYPYWFFWDEKNHNKKALFTWEADGREYIFVSSNGGVVDLPYFRMVNEFKKLKREGATNSIELEMMPVEMTDWEWHTYEDGAIVAGTFSPYQLPVTDGKDAPTEEEEGDIEDQINNSTTESSESKEKIFLAFHRGLYNKVASWNGTDVFPMPFTDEYFSTSVDTPTLTNSDGATLRLQNLNAVFYEGAYEINHRKGVKITSYDPNLFDTRGVYEINNKRYVCREVEYTLTAKGRKKAWTGTFYPIKISDTEAEQRWILTDGKWRDGGVWLDNGRWLDE